MATPSETTWAAEPGTLAKLGLLRRYLQPWFAIMAKGNRRLVYLDGFAGPGVYAGGEDGSPVVAAKVAADHGPRVSCEVILACIEERKDRADHLRKTLDGLRLPPHIRPQVIDGGFEGAVTSTLDALEARGAHLAPTFAFIDPFGFSGFPFALVRRLLKHRRCEVLVNLMKRDMNRFARTPEGAPRINETIGRSDAAALIAASPDGRATATALYAQALGEEADFVRAFEIHHDGQAVYDLVFASNHPLGHEKMKDAMWSMDRAGGFSFRGREDPHQALLFGAHARDHAAQVAELIAQRFAGQGEVSCEVIRTHIMNTSLFRHPHTTAALKYIEREEDAPVYISRLRTPGSVVRRRAGTFPDRVVVTLERRRQDTA